MNKINIKSFSFLLPLTCLVLVGCSSSDNDDESEIVGGDMPVETQGVLSGFADKPADSEPINIDMPDNLQNDIEVLFGNADAQPLAVEANDTLQDLIKRAGT